MKLLVTICLWLDLLLVSAFSPWTAYRASLSPLFESGTEPTTTAEDVVSFSLTKPLGMVLEENKENESQGVFVLEVGDSGSAAPYVDQIVGCKLLSVQGVDMTKSSFDEVMDAIVGAPETVDLNFEPKKEPLYAMGTTVKIVAEQSDFLVFEAKVGDNLRQALLDNGFEVYQGMKQKLGNCGGGGSCTFCAMDFVESDGWEERSEYEDKRLAKNPNARLACLNPIQGPVKLRKASR